MLKHDTPVNFSGGMDHAAYWIERLELLPHPEGGYYKEQYRSGKTVKKEDSEKHYAACTSIYYLLEGKDFSAFHRLKSDELWYFHKGAALNIYQLDTDGSVTVKRLSDSQDGELSIYIGSDTWFAAEVAGGSGYALVSCVVAPGFEFAEFEMADFSTFKTKSPENAELVKRLCR
jgi:predicted cupin superfamily sugar epimerase